MYSLNGCLTFEEAESILKLTSINIDNIEANAFAFGKYGSGSLNTGRAVELTNNLIDPNEVAYIENQIFSRWDFIVKAISDSVVIKNQVFKEESTFNLVSKNSIYIDNETLLEPSSNGYTLLEIDPNLTINTNCTMNSSRELPKDRYDAKARQGLIIFPNPNDGIFNILGDEEIDEVNIYDITGKSILKQNSISKNKLQIDASNLNSGLYLIKVIYHNGKIITGKMIKNQ